MPSAPRTRRRTGQEEDDRREHRHAHQFEQGREARALCPKSFARRDGLGHGVDRQSRERAPFARSDPKAADGGRQGDDHEDAQEINDAHH